MFSQILRSLQPIAPALKFDPNQPRHPKGTPQGGEFKGGGGPALRKNPTPEEFIAARDKSTRKGYLSPLSPDDLKGYKLYMSEDGTVGGAISPDGDMGNLFNNGGPKGAAQEILLQMIADGGKTADAFDGYLPRLYANFGIRETGRMKFNPEYAPPGWDFERDDSPDVIFLAHTGGVGTADDIRQRVRDKDQWIKPVPTTNYYEDYDLAKRDALTRSESSRTGSAVLLRKDGRSGVDGTPRQLGADGSPNAGGRLDYLSVLKWNESQHPRDEKGQFRGKSTYQPDHDAPVDGEWDWTGVDRDAMVGPGPKWKQQHRQLVADALRSWVGDPNSFRLHSRDALEGAPLPGSGSGKHMRAQAEALLWELENNTTPIPVPLYRGSGARGDLPGTGYSWSETKKIASAFAKRYGGMVEVLPAGTARGLRVRDYTADALGERQWIVRAGNSPVRKYDPQQPRDNQGQWVKDFQPSTGEVTEAEAAEFEELEEAWAGGVADYGDPNAAYAIQEHPKYDAYRQGVVDQLEQEHGTSITVYRAVSEDALKDMEAGSGLGPIGVTTDPELAKSWAKFAPNKDRELVILKTTIEPKIAVMRGKEAESEIVVDGDWISFHQWEEIGRATNKGFVVKKYDPNQPRGKDGRFIDLGLHGSTVTVLHGTTRQNAEAILAGGFKPGNPAQVAARIEQEYRLPAGSILKHTAFQFARGRTDLGRVHFTTDESVADQYSVPEVMQDALMSAHTLLHPTPDDVPFTKEMHAERKAWIDREARRLTEPALLAVTVPFETVGQHGFGKQFTLEEFKALLTKFPAAEENIFNNITIPIDALTGARIERRKWDESKHPRDKEGQFTTFYHGTVQEQVDSIKAHGLQTSHSGLAWPGLSQPGTIYLGRTKDAAMMWAESSTLRLDWKFENPTAVVLEVRVPDEVLAKSQRTAEPEGNLRVFQDVPPEWIVGVTVGRSHDQILGVTRARMRREEAKHIVPPFITAKAETFYVGLVVEGERVQKWDESKHPRDREGQFTEGVTITIPTKHSDLITEAREYPHGGAAVALIDPALTTRDEEGSLRVGDAGRLDFSKAHAGFLVVENIYLRSAYRGAGLGKRLYQKALEYAKSKGYQGIASGGEESRRNVVTDKIWERHRTGRRGSYDIMTEWKESTQKWNPDQPRDEDGKFTSYGTMLQVSAGSGFSQKRFVVLRTEKGWQKVNDFRVQNEQPIGTVGDVIDISGMEVEHTFQTGIGEDISHPLELAALPSGTKVVLSGAEGDRIFEKQGDQWISPEGKAVESYHFDPKTIKTRVKKKQGSWDESKHPRDTEGQFTEVLHGPRDAMDSLLNKERGVTIDPGDVRKMLELAAELPYDPKEPPNLLHLHVDGMEIFDRTGLGIARNDMPQIPREHRENFLKEMREQGVEIVEEWVDPLTLMPSQDEISARNVGQKIAKYEKNPKKKFPPLLVSSQDRLLDGHHHWAMMAALAIEFPGIKVPIYRLKVETKRALALMHAYDRKYDIKREDISGAAQKQEHKYGSTHIMIDPWSSAALSLNMARDAIRNEDCMATGKDVDPNHITVRFGLLNEDRIDDLRSFIAGQVPFEAEVSGIELFPASEHSDGAVPVVARFTSPELHALEAEIGKHAAFKEKSFPVYKPHSTLAYVKPEVADLYGALPVRGDCLVHSVTISHQSGTQETIPFGKSLTQKYSPDQPRVQGRFASRYGITRQGPSGATLAEAKARGFTEGPYYHSTDHARAIMRSGVLSKGGEEWELEDIGSLEEFRTFDSANPTFMSDKLENVIEVEEHPLRNTAQTAAEADEKGWQAGHESYGNDVITFYVKPGTVKDAKGKTLAGGLYVSDPRNIIPIKGSIKPARKVRQTVEKYDPSQPRDAQGQWVSIGRALSKTGRVTVHPKETAFLLPDGTRISAAGYNAHAKLARMAGYNDLQKVIVSGIVRYIPGVGIEAHSLTREQAQIVVDDWESEFAGPHGWNALQVDLIGEDDRGVFSTTARQFDRLTVEGLLNFVNKKRKVAADKTGRYVTPFVSFDKLGNESLRMIASLNSSRLATWGFTAEAEVRGLARYRLTAVLDGRTSEFCRMIDGKIFEVEDAREKVIEVLNVQNPEDLRVVQPWPKQTKAAMAQFEEMSAEELTARGLHIPPYHPHCRTLLREVKASAGEEMEETATIPDEVEAFHQVTAADLAELGVTATPEDVEQWNTHVGMSPTELLSKLTGMPPQEVMTKGKGLGTKPIEFEPTGNIAFKAHGDVNGVEFKLRALLDPFTGTYYLNQADLLKGSPKAEVAFLKNLFTSLIEMGQKSTATSVAVGVAGNAAYYAKLGFLPDELEWDSLRRYALEGSTVMPEVLASLAPEDALLVKHLLLDKSVGAMSALVDLPFTYQGKTIGEWLFGEAAGTWALDLTDLELVTQAKAYLSS